MACRPSPTSASISSRNNSKKLHNFLPYLFRFLANKELHSPIKGQSVDAKKWQSDSAALQSTSEEKAHHE